MPAAPAPPVGMDAPGCVAGILEAFQRIVPGHRQFCEIRNNSASTIYLNAKSHANGDPQLPGGIIQEPIDIPRQGCIHVDRREYELSNPYEQILIHLSLDRNGIGDLIWHPHELRDGAILNLSVNDGRVISEDGGQQDGANNV